VLSDVETLVAYNSNKPLSYLFPYTMPFDGILNISLLQGIARNLYVDNVEVFHCSSDNNNIHSYTLNVRKGQVVTIDDLTGLPNWGVTAQFYKLRDYSDR
jgi:hypothetical protein